MAMIWGYEPNPRDDSDEEAEWGGRQPGASVTCKRCGKAGLTWLMKDGAWRLFSDEGMHICAAPKNPFGPVL